MGDFEEGAVGFGEGFWHLMERMSWAWADIVRVRTVEQQRIASGSSEEVLVVIKTRAEFLCCSLQSALTLALLFRSRRFTSGCFGQQSFLVFSVKRSTSITDSLRKVERADASSEAGYEKQNKLSQATSTTKRTLFLEVDGHTVFSLEFIHDEVVHGRELCH